jgi:hypothetical protein
VAEHVVGQVLKQFVAFGDRQATLGRQASADVGPDTMTELVRIGLAGEQLGAELLDERHVHARPQFGERIRRTGIAVGATGAGLG